MGAGTAAEATVRGAGIFGLSVAWALARRGVRVAVIDPGGPGAGASGGVVGALAPHVPEAWNDKKAFQLDALLMAADWWAEVAAAGGGDPGFARTGRLQPVTDAAALDRAMARGDEAAKLWRGAARWAVIDAPEVWGPVSATGKVIHDTLSARLAPRAACAALAAAVTARGGTILSEAPDRGPVVHCTGWRGLAVLTAARGGTAVPGVKGQAAVLRHDAADQPQIFAGGIHFVPHADGTVAVGSTSERDWTDETATDGQLDAVIAAARAAVPALTGAPVIGRWAGVRPRTRSRGPVLGGHPLHPGQFIANGGFKIGFGIAPLVGEAMADLVLDGRTDRIPPGFRPEGAVA